MSLYDTICDEMKSSHTRILRLLLLLSFFIFAGIYVMHCATRSLDPDLGWHLRMGEEIVETKDVPTVETWNTPIFGEQWIDHEWLLNVGFFEIYHHFGFEGLAYTSVFLLLLLFGVQQYVLLKKKNEYLRSGNDPDSANVWTLWHERPYWHSPDHAFSSSLFRFFEMFQKSHFGETSGRISYFLTTSFCVLGKSPRKLFDWLCGSVCLDGDIWNAFALPHACPISREIFWYSPLFCKNTTFHTCCFFCVPCRSYSQSVWSKFVSLAFRLLERWILHDTHYRMASRMGMAHRFLEALF